MEISEIITQINLHSDAGETDAFYLAARDAHALGYKLTCTTDCGRLVWSYVKDGVPGLTDARKSHVENVWLYRTLGWDASFQDKLNDVMVHAFWNDHDYDQVRAHLTARYR